MMVATLIGIMISIIVGVALIPTMLESVEGAEEDLGSGASALVGVLPYIFVAVILLGAIAWIGAVGDDRPSRPKSLKPEGARYDLTKKPKVPEVTKVKPEIKVDVYKPLPEKVTQVVEAETTKVNQWRKVSKPIEKLEVKHKGLGARMKKSVKGAFTGEYQED